MTWVEPNRYQCWWHSEVIGWRVDAYPTPRQANARLEEVQEREYFLGGVVIDMAEHLTSQEGFPTQQEHEEHHRDFHESITHV